MAESRKNFTTIAIDRDVLREIRKRKIHPRVSDNEILQQIISESGSKKVLNRVGGNLNAR